MEQVEFETLLARIAQVPVGGIVAIDGCCASGKSTLGARLSEALGCPLFHLDDFFLRPEQRTPERFAQPGGNMDRERLEAEVLAPLRRGEAAVYRFADEETVHGVRLVFDSDLSDLKRQRNVETSGECHEMPALLPRSFRLEYRDGGEWKEFASVAENRHRYVKLSGAPCRCREFRFAAGEAWGGGASRVFSFDVF